MKASLFAIIFLFMYSASFSEIQDTVEFRKSNLQELQEDIYELISSPELSNSFIGISVLSLETGEYIFNHNNERNFIPASTQKLITTAAALEYLGSEYQFRTNLYLDGDLSENGEFFGNLIIRGLGDPTINNNFYDKPLNLIYSWVDTLESLGINSVRGNIIGDDNFFDNSYYGAGWSWDDMKYYYSAQVNALAFNNNVVNINVSQGDTIGDPANYVVYPKNNYVRVINSINTLEKGNYKEIVAHRETGTNIIELYGGIDYDSTNINSENVAVTIDNPTLFFLNIFKTVLDKKQIRFRGALLDIDDLNYAISYNLLNPFIEHKSVELSNIIAHINKNSDNLVTEMLLKTIAAEMLGYGSYDNAIQLIEKYLNKCGIPTQNITIVDGSGLSRLNLVSPKYLVDLLSSIYRSENKEVFYNSLAVPGKKGTLQRRMKKSLAENQVVGKTGTMSTVSNISGYITTKDGEDLAYAIMFQNLTVPVTYAQNTQDLILMRLAGFSRN